MTITAATPLTADSKGYGSFTFSDGASIRVSGGLICSEHGRRRCRHHQLAHDAIIAKAASQEAATAAAEEMPLLLNIEVEVALAEAEMDLAGFYWNDDARAWLPKPTFDEARERQIMMSGW